MAGNRVDFDVAMEVASHEALIRQTYKDRVGVLTWCVGMNNAIGHTVERYIGKPASLQHCRNIYAWALDNYATGARPIAWRLIWPPISAPPISPKTCSTDVRSAVSTNICVSAIGSLTSMMTAL